MGLVERLAELLGLNRHESQFSGTPGLRDSIETARKAKFSEDYPQALAALDRALALLNPQMDSAAAVVILLQQADVCTRMGAFSEAAAVLDAALQCAGDHKVQIAYIAAAQGMLELAQDEPDAARAHYDRALQIARDIGSLGAEGRARGLLGQLALLEGNATYAHHLLPDALSKLNDAADIELTPLFLGLLGQAHIELGRAAEGSQLIERALHLAASMGDRVSERRWSIVLAERAFNEGRLPEARRRYQTALGLWGTQMTEARVHTEISLSKTCILLRAYDEAISTAQTAIRHAETVSAELMATARGALGMALRSAGRNAEAIPHLAAAAAGDRPNIDVLRALAGAYADTGATDEAVAAGDRAFKAADKHGKPLEKAQALRDLGLLYYSTRRPQEAIATWTKALEIYEEESAHAQIARLYSDIGSARKLLGHHQRAVRDYERALTVLNSIPEGDIETRGLVLSNAANAYAEQGDADSADSFFTEAIALAEKLGDANALSMRRSNYAYFLIQMGRPRRAISLLEEALRHSRQQGAPLPVSVQLDNLGLAYDACGDYATALEYHEQAGQMISDLSEPYWQASIGINLANTHLALGQVDEAAPLFEAAHRQARALDNAELIVRALTGLGLLALRRQDTAAAAPLLDEAVALARRLDLRRWLADALSARSEAAAALGQPQAAASFWEEAARYYNMLRMLQGKRSPTWLPNQHKA
jgi:tetratricopeptide (TPR) repeat protein